MVSLTIKYRLFLTSSLWENGYCSIQGWEVIKRNLSLEVASLKYFVIFHQQIKTSFVQFYVQTSKYLLVKFLLLSPKLARIPFAGWPPSAKLV